jgi:hypothetical protein
MGLGTELPLLLALGFVVLGPKRMHTMLDTWRGPKRNFTRRATALNLSSREKSKLRCRTAEMMMRLPVERPIARTVYEEVRFVHANSADSICGKWPHIGSRYKPPPWHTPKPSPPGCEPYTDTTGTSTPNAPSEEPNKHCAI